MAKVAGSLWIETTNLHFVAEDLSEWRYSGELVSAASIFRPYQEVVLEDNPSHYWRLNETSGLVAVDMVGGLNCAITPSVLINQMGKHGKAMTFTGPPHTGKIQTIAPISLISPCSLEMWFNTPFAGYENPLGGIFTWPYGSAGGNWSFNIRVQPNGAITIFLFSSSDIAVGVAVMGDPVSPNIWNHLVLIFLGSTGHLFINNEFRETNTPLDFVSSTNRPFEIGYYPDSPYTFTGSIDEVAIYPYALSPAQVAKHFNPPPLNLSGSLWVEADHLHYIDAVGDERRIPNILIKTTTGLEGSIWVDNQKRISWLASDRAHRQGHIDVAHVDHTDDTHNDSGHGDIVHSDVAHSDYAHIDHTDNTHSDVAHSDVAHVDHTDDSHGDLSHWDSHTDVAHVDTHSDVGHSDGGGHGDHQDVGHGDSGGHGDTPHSDTHGDSHGDVAHSDRAHSDHTDNNHDDTAHKDVTHSDATHNDHKDGHGDTVHADIAHTDVAHDDTGHSDHGDVAGIVQPEFVE